METVSSVKRGVDRFICNIENNSINCIQLVLWLIVIGLIKYLFEDIIFFRQLSLTDHFNASLYLVLFYAMVYISSMIVVKVLSGQEMSKVINASLFFYPLLLLGPVIDYFVHPVPEPYHLVTWGTTVWDSLLRYPGITVTGLYMMFLGACYVGFKKGLFRAVISFLLNLGIYYYIYASVFLRDIRGYIISTGIIDSLPLDFQQYPYITIFNIIYIVVAILCSVFFLYFYDVMLFKKVIKRIRFERALQYILILTFGFSIIGDFHPIRLFIHFVNIVALFCAWVGSVLINDYHDYESDRINQVKRIELALTKGEAYSTAIILWLFSLALAMQISRVTFIIYFCIIVISYLYSAPPARFKQYLLSSIFIGFNTFLVVLAAVLSSINLYHYSDRILYVAALLGITMAAGANVIDLKDYEGDRQTGVRSIPTIWGLPKAKKIIAVITGISYLVLGYYLAGIMRTPWYYAAILPAIAMPWMVLHYQENKKWWIVYLGFHMITLINGTLINIFLANYHVIFQFE